MDERLALPTLDHGVAGSSPAGSEILPEPKRRFIAQSLSCSPFHRLEMTEILLKGRKTLTHPSIHFSYDTYVSCYFVNHMQVRNLRNRLPVNMVCEWAWVSIPGERVLPKSLNWCSRLELRSHVQIRTYARTHTGKRAHVLLITMALKQKQK